MSDLIDAVDRKAALRSRILAARRTIGPERLARDARLVCDTLRSRLPDLLRRAARQADGTVTAYVPVGSEPGGPDLPDVLRAALPPGMRLVLPVLGDDLDLDWAVYDRGLVPTRRGLSEPTGPRLGVTAVRRAALMIVPALAVDHAGVRLGRGGGSYDRALARVESGAEIVALLHRGELLAEPLPAEPHDRPVTAVITPDRGLVRLRPPGPTPRAGDGSRPTETGAAAHTPGGR
ncbi:MAG TPA: 5-formyltetrahydrofolate cyclo-ligase [Natronosporangium sp.]|nr:5-formyltetrahydrofolate cyclo-ligase [Natronosporangium sp.]